MREEFCDEEIEDNLYDPKHNLILTLKLEVQCWPWLSSLSIFNDSSLLSLIYE